MRKTILTLSLLTSVILFSQTGRVGINTENPQNTFHIDGGKDNPASGAPTTLQQANDVIVTNTGQIGIGTTTPSQNLDVATGNVRVRSINANAGTATTDKVVVADANGVLKTIPKQNALISGGDLADNVVLNTVTAPLGSDTAVAATLKTINFTIDYASLVTFDYQLAYAVPTINTLSDGRTRRISSGFLFTASATPSVPINNFFALSSNILTVANAGSNIPGFYYLTGSQTLKLDAGAYTIILSGSVRNSGASTVPFSVEFGSAANDYVTITAKLIQ